MCPIQDYSWHFLPFSFNFNLEQFFSVIFSFLILTFLISLSERKGNSRWYFNASIVPFFSMFVASFSDEKSSPHSFFFRSPLFLICLLISSGHLLRTILIADLHESVEHPWPLGHGPDDSDRVSHCTWLRPPFPFPAYEVHCVNSHRIYHMPVERQREGTKYSFMAVCIPLYQWMNHRLFNY